MKVVYFPSQPHCFAFGGFDLQMINTLNAVNKLEDCASKIDFWSRDNSFEIIHLWNITPYNYNIIDWGKKANKKIVATILFPYNSKMLWLKYYKNYFSTGLKLAKHYHQLIDQFVVLNESQKEVLSKYYNIEKNKIEIIPNVVSDLFFNHSFKNKSLKSKDSNYILTTGNICFRKNQLNLAKAILEIENINLKIVGKQMEGELEYHNELLKLISLYPNKIELINELPNHSDDYINLYKNCIGFALPSYEETQPISALEAVAMNKKVLLMNLSYAHQKYYKGAFLAKNGTPNEIKIELIKLLNSKENNYNSTIEECRDYNVGRKYLKLYKNLFKTL